MLIVETHWGLTHTWVYVPVTFMPGSRICGSFITCMNINLARAANVLHSKLNCNWRFKTICEVCKEPPEIYCIIAELRWHWNYNTPLFWTLQNNQSYVNCGNTLGAHTYVGLCTCYIYAWEQNMWFIYHMHEYKFGKSYTLFMHKSMWEC